MSDRARTGDTSAPLRTPLVPRLSVATNPLLSAAITNLTLDDFTHNAMLLPAASPFVPVVPTPPPALNTLLPPNSDGSILQPTSVVFAGPGGNATSSIPLNTDTFSEISLEPEERGQPPQPEARGNYAAPGQSATVAALSQLPIVASTVFSSFSNIISGITSDATPTPPPSSVRPPSAHQYHQQPAVSQAYTAYQPLPNASSSPALANPHAQFYHQPPPVGPAVVPVAAPPPRLYSPHDIAAATAAGPAEPSRPPNQQLPPTGGNANTYRLTQKRKIYAPLPGLNTTHPADLPFGPNTAAAIQPPSAGPSLPPGAVQQPVQQPEQQQHQSFSLSALIHKVPLLEKFQQLTVAAAAPTNAPSDNAPFSLSVGTPTSAYNPQLLTHSAPTSIYDQSSQFNSQPAPCVAQTNPDLFNANAPPQLFNQTDIHQPTASVAQLVNTVPTNYPAPDLFNTNAPPQFNRQPIAPPQLFNPTDISQQSANNPAPDLFQTNAPPAYHTQPIEPPQLFNPIDVIQQPAASATSPPNLTSYPAPDLFNTNAPPVVSQTPNLTSFGGPTPLNQQPASTKYRLKGKPLYKSPNTYGIVSAAPSLYQPAAISAPSAAGPPQLYNPLECSGVPTTNAYVSAPVHPQFVPHATPVNHSPAAAPPTAIASAFSAPALPPTDNTFGRISPPQIPPTAGISTTVDGAVPTQLFNPLQSAQPPTFVQESNVPADYSFGRLSPPSRPVQQLFTSESRADPSNFFQAPAVPTSVCSEDYSFGRLSPPSSSAPSFFQAPTPTNEPPLQKESDHPVTTAPAAPLEDYSFGRISPPSASTQPPIVLPTIGTLADPSAFFQASIASPSVTSHSTELSTPAVPLTDYSFGRLSPPSTSASAQPLSIFFQAPAPTDPPVTPPTESELSAPTDYSFGRISPPTGGAPSAPPTFSSIAPLASAQIFPPSDPSFGRLSPPQSIFNPNPTDEELESRSVQENLPPISLTPVPVFSAVSTNSIPAVLDFFNPILNQNVAQQSSVQSELLSQAALDNDNFIQSAPPVAFQPFQAEPEQSYAQASAANGIDLSTINPVDFFENTPAAPASAAQPYDNYINLEQQTLSSFIQPHGDGESHVPSVELPDLIAPGRESVPLPTVEPIVPAPATAYSGSNFFQPPVRQTAAPAPNTFASFFDTPTSTANNNNASNWFNPIPAPQSEQPAWTAGHNPAQSSPAIVKPQPTNPSNFFSQSPATNTPAAPAAPSSLDIVNNSQIANFFNNPPPLSDDATQQQLDLVKDCNRNFQAIVNPVSVRDCNANGAFPFAGTAPHRRLEEIAQQFDTSAGGGTEFGIETRSFASSNVVEPASSVQSDLSEYGASVTGRSIAAEQAAAGEEDTEVQHLLNPTASAAAATFNHYSVSDSQAEFSFTTETESLAVGDGMAASTGNIAYRPVCTHWFYNKTGLSETAATTSTPVPDDQTPGSETNDLPTGPSPAGGASSASATKSQWTPFSAADSLSLERALDDGHTVCTTNGGRFDVQLPQRRRAPVYWQAAADEVRRCSWFYKGSDSRLVPYEEDIAALLEVEYRQAAELGKWNRKIALPGGDTVVLHGPNVMVQFNKSQTPDMWTENATVASTTGGAASAVSPRPRIVRRGIDEWPIEEGESEQVDHLMFMVHGIGAACDLKFRTVEQVVEEFRSTAHLLVQSHYRNSIDIGRVGRIEVLPISWHSELHSAESGIDEKLRAITLASIPKLRTFTNSTLLDILFYTSPVFCQQIIDAVAGSINRKYQLYCERNPRFGGAVSLAGHSLGSVIVFDLLQNQRTDAADDISTGGKTVANSACTVGQAGTGQQSILYPQLVFKPRMFFAFGSPIGMFVTVRGIHSLGVDYRLPTCAGFYNIFHPYDPVAYRIEALINAELAGRSPVLIPHHKGRKRMHLELRETIQRVGNDIKQRVVDTFRSTMNRVYNLSPITLQKNIEQRGDLQLEVDEVLEREKQLALDAVESVTSSGSSASGDQEDVAGYAGASMPDIDPALGRLNGGRRVDYVLQEAPLEFFNEYLFALTSHVCYWESADTTLFIAKEIYASMGILTDHKQPQQTTMVLPPVADS